MNIFASERIKPESIKFPGKTGKLEWLVVNNKDEFIKQCLEAKKLDYIVIDAVAGENINGITIAKILTEIVIERHETLPIVLVVGPDAKMKKEIEIHLGNCKRWIDISRGK